MIQSSHPTTSQGLNRSLGLFTAVTLVISQMIGSGVFKKVAPMAVDLQAAWPVLLAWVAAGTITLMGALTNAEAAGLIADAGGQYAYFKKMYGRTFAFFFGWASFTVIQSATIAGVAYVFAMSVSALIPVPHLNESLESFSVFGLQPLDNLGVKAITILLITILTTINYRGIKFGGLISNLIASTMVTAIILIVVASFSLSAGSIDNLRSTTPLNPEATITLGAFFTAMMAAFWAYEGWNNLSFLGAEIKNPQKNIPIALILGVFLVMLLYTIVNTAYLYVLPVQQLIDTATATNEIAAVTVISSFLGPTGTTTVLIMILISTFGSTNGVILTASRMYYAMAQGGHFFKKVGESHPKHATPGNSLIYQGVWASVLVLSGSFDQLTDMLVFAAFIYYGAMAAGVIVLRYKMPNAHRPYKAIGYPVLPALFILFCIALVVVSCVERPGEAITGLLLIASGIPFFLYWNKQKPSE